MANPHKGEHRLVIAGEDYVLRFSADTVCDLEDQLNMTLSEISAKLQDATSMRMSTVRTMFCAGLSDNHSELDETARRKLFKALTPIEAVSHVAKAFMLAFSVEEATGGNDANPPQPGASLNGTGPVSTVTGAA